LPFPGKILELGDFPSLDIDVRLDEKVVLVDQKVVPVDEKVVPVDDNPVSAKNGSMEGDRQDSGTL